jgi:hypothetical protein
MLVRLLAAAALATATLTVAACGAGAPASGDAGSKDDPAAMRRALLDYARCMREHGVDMPDPTFSDGGARVEQRSGPGGLTPEQTKSAEQACKHFQEKIKPPKMSDAEKEKFKKQALAQARCMRAHGIDMPDPTFDENGGAMMRMREGAGVRPDDPKFKAAARACMPEDMKGSLKGSRP